MPMLRILAGWSSALVLGLVGAHCFAVPSRESTVSAPHSPGDRLRSDSRAHAVVSPRTAERATARRGAAPTTTDKLEPGDSLVVRYLQAKHTDGLQVAPAPGDSLLAAYGRIGVVMPGDTLNTGRRRAPSRAVSSSTIERAIAPGDRLHAPR